MPKKLNLAELKNCAISKGLTLLSTEYIDSYQPLAVSCPKHGTQSVTAKQLKLGTGCRPCGITLRGIKSRNSLDSVKKAFLSAGYTLLSTAYQSSKSLLKALCPKHGEISLTYGAIKAGRGCRDCGYAIVANKIRTSLEEIKNIVAKTNYSLISDSYDSYDQKIILDCPKHGHFSISLYNLKKQQGCKKCGNESSGNKRRTSQVDAQNFTESAGYKLVGEYKGAAHRNEFECPKHGKFIKFYYDLKAGGGCPKCGNLESKPEKMISEFIESLGLEVIRNSYEIISPFELDIYVPSHKLAIEYCGLYWHSEEKKPKDYHFDKMAMCKKLGIQLITLFEDEWLERSDQIKLMLTAKLGLLPKIYARKCKIVEIDKETAKQFVNDFHLQGYSNSNIFIGLYSEDSLVGVITGGKHHRKGQNSEIVLNRLCFGNVSVVGGSSKLFKAFKAKCFQMGYSKIVSWSDNRWSEGNVYKLLGFNLEQELNPDYSYIKQQKRFSKQSHQKKHLLAKGGKGSTESEMAMSIGLFKIWDCGKLRWTLDI